MMVEIGCEVDGACSTFAWHSNDDVIQFGNQTDAMLNRVVDDPRKLNIIYFDRWQFSVEDKKKTRREINLFRRKWDQN